MADSGARDLASGLPAPVSELSIRVEPYAECSTRVLEFRNQNRGTSLSARYVDWRYRGRPCQESALVVWVNHADGRTLGSAGLIPHDFHVLDAVRPIGVVGDISVVAEARGMGIASRMLTFLAEDARVRALGGTFVLPNAGATGPLLAAGWVNAATIRRRMRPLGVASAGGGGRGALRALVHRALRFAARPAPLPPGSTCRIQKQQLRFDDRFDALWSRLPKTGRVIAVRNAAYLAWRFADHPLMKFDLVEVDTAGQLSGYAVLSRHGTTVAVDDFVAIDSTAAKAVASAALAHAYSQQEVTGVQSRHCEPTWMPAGWSLKRGFVARPDESRALWRATGADPSGAMADPANWLVTPGDKDV